MLILLLRILNVDKILKDVGRHGKQEININYVITIIIITIADVMITTSESDKIIISFYLTIKKISCLGECSKTRYGMSFL